MQYAGFILSIVGVVAALAALPYTVRALRHAKRQTEALEEEREEKVRLTRFTRTRAVLRSDYREVLERAVAATPEHRADGELKLFGRPGWILPAPVDLSEVEVALTTVRDRSFEPFVERWEQVWPRSERGTALRRYSEAVHEHDRPGLWWEGSESYRLLAVTPTDGSLRLDYGIGKYHDAIDTQEALGYLWAAGLMSKEELPDPFDLSWRCASTAICTLTIVTTSEPTFFMHYRDAAQVAISGNQYHVTPCGEFEPSSIAPDYARDFDLWKNIQREYAEEFLNLEVEYGGRTGAPPEYDRPPLADLDRLCRSGRLRLWCLGLGINPVTHKPELLVVAVFAEDGFNEVFPGLLHERSTLRDGEGDKIRGTFDAAGVKAYLDSDQLNPFADALLRLSWRHRATLLG